jgi:hypothetical protein
LRDSLREAHRRQGVRVAVMMLLGLQLGLVSCVSAGQREWTTDNYRLWFDSVVAKQSEMLDRTAASGIGRSYYTFSYALDGILGMYEGTHSPEYLEQALKWAEVMISKATIIDVHNLQNWSGDWLSPYATTPISHHLHDLQGSTQLTRVARIVLTDAELKQRFGDRATAIYRFVKDNIIDKWLYARNAESWYRANAVNTARHYNDKTALVARILIDLYRIDGSVAYSSLASHLLEGFKARLRPHGRGSLVWDDGTLDTSHANRMPSMVVAAYEAGLVVSKREIEGLSRLLTEIIWDGSITSPRFTNFIYGTNQAALQRPPYGLGQIYSGWLALGAHDAGVQWLGDAVVSALMSGVRNASIDYMASVWGEMCLLGHLARNRAKLLAD